METKMNNEQKKLTELMDHILTWDEETNCIRDVYMAAKLAEYLTNLGYVRHISRKERLITAFGKTQRLSDWAREYGVHFQTISMRLDRGWDAEDAITAPPSYRNNGKKTCVVQCDLNGKMIKTWSSIKEAAESVGCANVSIMQCCQGRLATVCGYIWKYMGKTQKSRRGKSTGEKKTQTSWEFHVQGGKEK